MSFEELLTFLSTNQPWLSEADNLQNRATFLEASQQIARRLQIQEGKALSEPIPNGSQRLFPDCMRTQPLWFR
jgi:hypothetical protein